MSDKIYLDSNGLTCDSFVLARQILDSGFVPDMILAIWRGGTPVGIAVHEFLKYKGIDCYHTVIKACSYTGIAERGEPEVENLDYVMARLKPTSRVLIVDDVFDSGRTAQTLKRLITQKTSFLRFAMLYYKPARNETGFVPDYFVKETDSWLVFPHELTGLTVEEIREKKPFVYALLDEATEVAQGLGARG